MRFIASLVFFSVIISADTALPNNTEIIPASPPVTVQFENGSFYTGQVVNGLRNGIGRYVAADGSEYHGEYRDGVPHGEGTYHYPDGRSKWVRYQSGRLVDSRLLGHETGADGCAYGEFIFQGRYSGWFRGNKVKGYVPHGRGIMIYSSGSVFSGQWENGKMNGNGSVKWEDGSTYAGQWLKGKRTGYGTYTWPNGDFYVGEWKENQMCGRGIYYYNNGKFKKGVWKEKTVSSGNLISMPSLPAN